MQRSSIGTVGRAHFGKIGASAFVLRMENAPSQGATQLEKDQKDLQNSMHVSRQLFHRVRRSTRPSAPLVHNAPASNTISVTPKCAREVDPE